MPPKRVWGLTLLIPTLFGLSLVYFIIKKKFQRKTVHDVIVKLETDVGLIIKSEFKEKALIFPPNKMIFLGLKEEKQLQIFVETQAGWNLFTTYPILKASGTAGPKLKEGDRQVPEGFYQILSLNPNSSFHLSLELDYPSQEDRHIAKKENRSNLGGEIFIHGKESSIGCLAMGDENIEKIFYLAYKVGLKNIEVVISPWDFRIKDLRSTDKDWLKQRYVKILEKISKLPNQ
jgi:murein L,D-transpeptidase YafK